MGTFGDEFRNVTQGTPHLTPDNGLDVRADLQSILYGVSRGSPGRPPGGIVYLPPGSYLVRSQGMPTSRADYLRAMENPDILVPNNVLLWFAPGAVLVLGPQVVVSIAGDLRAETTRIFRTENLQSGDFRRGRVVFHTTQVQEIYPEWWGALALQNEAAPTMARDNAPEFRACFQAAHTDRSLPGRQWPVLPVIMSGTYPVGSEIEIKQEAAPLGADGAPDRRQVSGLVNPAGVVILGRRGPGGSGINPPAFFAHGAFEPGLPTAGAPDLRTLRASGRALLRIVGLLGSVIDGIGFDGARIVSACLQITGNSARSSVIRNCSFHSACHVLAQVGDYVIESDNPQNTLTICGRPLAQCRSDVRSDFDLSGLTFENCTFETNLAPGEGEARARAMVGIVFNANQTFPMTLDHCLFTGSMAACIEARGGTLVIRGGNAQNQLTPTAYVPLPAAGRPTRDMPRGGVDIFIGDVLRVQSGALPVTGPATTLPASPTGLTVIEFESQSNQFLDTFRHISASANFTVFLPTLLQNVTARATTSPSAQTPPIIDWSGPSIAFFGSEACPPSAGVSGTTTSGGGSPLTLVGCAFRGPRGGVETSTDLSREPPGAVVVDELAMAVNDVGTRLSPRLGSDTQPIFFMRRRLMPLLPTSYVALPRAGDLSAFAWYRRL